MFKASRFKSVSVLLVLAMVWILLFNDTAFATDIVDINIEGAITGNLLQPAQLISTGESHTLAIKAGGELWAWGSNWAGQLGDGTTIDKFNPVKIMDDVVSVSAGGNHTMAIKTSGELWAWGSNWYGQLGDGTTANKLSPVKIMDDVASVSAGYNYTVAIKTDGELWAWGNNGSGQLGDGTLADKLSPVKIMEGMASVSAGKPSANESHTLAVKIDGELWAWGYNNYGQLGDGTTATKQSPVKVMDDVLSVSAGGYHTIAIKTNSELWAWGGNYAGQLGEGTTENKYSPVKIMDGVADVSAGLNYTMAIKTDGVLWGWGGNNTGRLGDGTLTDRYSPVKIMADVARVSAGGGHTVVIKTSGELLSWGYNSHGQLGDGTASYSPNPMKIMEGVISVSAGGIHTMAIRTGNELWGWGQNGSGQLGDGTLADKYNPVKIMEGVISVSAGGYHTMAIKAGNELWAWGANSDGQLGDGSTASKRSPVKIMDDVASVSAGRDHTMAIKTNGELWGWGGNFVGQLGDGATTGKLSPVKIMDDVAFVSAGEGYTLAIKTNGELWAWGYNGAGQLGDGTTVDKRSPVKIMDGIVDASAAAGHTLAIKTGGELWAWGYNGYGQLGDGTITDKHSPVKSMDDVSSIAAGRNYSMIIKTGGDLWSWGYNWYGQLGDGAATDRQSPVKIMDGATSVSTGTAQAGEPGHAMAVKTNGELWAWGYNWFGQLGNGSAAYKSSPVKIWDGDATFVPVTNISVGAATAAIGTLPTLTGVVSPLGATNQTITWSVADAGATGAAIIGSNTFYATASGTAIIQATIANGSAVGTDYVQNFIATVSFSQVTTHVVTFKSSGGLILKTENVISGQTATAPAYPVRPGYMFVGWDTAFHNVTGDLTVTAQYYSETDHPVGVVLSDHWLQLSLGEAYRLTFEPFPDETDSVGAELAGVEWATSDAGIAVVENGLVTTVAEGTAIIAVMSTTGGAHDVCTVKVKNTAKQNPSTVIQQTDHGVDKNYDAGVTNGYYVSTLQTSVNSDGSISVCSAAWESDFVYIYEYEADMAHKKTLAITKELPLFGAFTRDEAGNYYVFYAKTVEDGEFEEQNMMLVQYNSSGIKEKVFTLKAFPEDSFNGVQYPFAAGSCRMEIAGDRIAVYFAGVMFVWGDGLNHQASYGFILDVNTFELAEYNIPYVSHSFDQFILVDGDSFIFADHGDASPRAFAFEKIEKDSRQSIYYHNKATSSFRFKGSSGANQTFAQMGGLANTSTGYIFAGTYENKTTSPNIRSSRNLFVVLLDKDLESCSDPIWLTDYDDWSLHNVVYPKIVELDKDYYLLLWEDKKIESNAYATTWMMVIDKDGDVLKPAIELPGVRLSEYDVLRYNALTGFVHWAVSFNEKDVVIYCLKPDLQVNVRQLGDVNKDLSINMPDVLTIYQHFRGMALLTEEEFLTADVNNDDVVNMQDVLLVYQYFRGKITEFSSQ